MFKVFSYETSGAKVFKKWSPIIYECPMLMACLLCQSLLLFSHEDPKDIARFSRIVDLAVVESPFVAQRREK